MYWNGCQPSEEERGGGSLDPPPLDTGYRALIRPSGEDAMGRSCILDAPPPPPGQGHARGSADARSTYGCLLVIAEGSRARGQ